jgi:hypothetical protein
LPAVSTWWCIRGDLDAAKAWDDRNRIVFGGRNGYARLAIDNGVPIVPIVTAGAGESLFVISSGERLARATRIDKLLRLKAAPISVSLPWGSTSAPSACCLSAAAVQDRHPGPAGDGVRRR